MVSPKREAEVWERVMAVSAQAPACCVKKTEELTAQQVMELLTAERCDSITYQVLAGRVRTQPRQKLLWLARQEQAHYARLETIYYLMTGKKPCPDKPKSPGIVRVDEALRSRYMEEIRGAERYRSLSEKAGSFGKVFCQLADEEERHADEVLKILQQCL